MSKSAFSSPVLAGKATAAAAALPTVERPIGGLSIAVLTGTSGRGRPLHSTTPKSRYSAKRRIVRCYPKVPCASIARRQIAAADRLRVHPLGPRSGGNGPAASRPLPLLARPPRPPARRPRAAPAHRRPAARARSCSAPPRPLGRTSASLGSVVGMIRSDSRAQPPTSRIFSQQPVQQESTRERTTRV